MKVMVNESANFYNGRVGDVLDTREVVGIKVFWVAIPSGAGGTIEFAIRESNVIVIPEIENV